MDGLGGFEQRDTLSDKVRITPTELGADVINASKLGQHTPATEGKPYIAPLWDLLKVLTRSSSPPAYLVENEAFELLVQ
jgi:hypothetical protein